MVLLKRYIAWLFFIVSFAWALRVLLLPNYPDFQVHYYGAQHLIEGENPYLPDTNYFTPQVYPPFDMVFFIPLSFFPFDIASKVWVIISIAAVLGSIYLINKIYKKTFFSTINLFLMTLAFVAFPTKFTFGMGQINAVILLFTTLFLYYLVQKKELKSGFVLAYPIMLKFFPLLVGPYLLFTKRWKVLLSLMITTLVLFLVSLFFVPLQTQMFFVQTLLPDLLASWKGDYYNQSFTGLLMRSEINQSTMQTVRMLFPLIMIFISFVYIFYKRKKSSLLLPVEVSLLIIVSLLVNNFSWQHHFILLLIPFYVLVYTIIKSKHLLALLPVIAISYSLIAINFTQPTKLPWLLQNHVFFGGFLLWILTIYILVRLKSSKITL